MLQNMLEMSKFKSLDEEMKSKYEGAILNCGETLRHHVDFEQLF